MQSDTSPVLNTQVSMTQACLKQGQLFVEYAM